MSIRYTHRQCHYCGARPTSLSDMQLITGNRPPPLQHSHLYFAHRKSNSCGQAYCVGERSLCNTMCMMIVCAAYVRILEGATNASTNAFWSGMYQVVSCNPSC